MKHKLISIAETFSLWSRKVKLEKKLAFLSIGLAVISSIATYIALTQSSSPFGPDPHKVLALLIIDLTLFCVFIVISSRKLFHIIVKEKQKSSRLQARIVVAFTLFTAIPTVTITIFSTVFFNFGIQSWFNKRVSAALDNSLEVAEAYLRENIELMRNDIIEISNEVEKDFYWLSSEPIRFNDLLTKEVQKRSLSEALVFAKDKRVIAQTRLSFSFGLDRLANSELKEADKGKIVIIPNDKKDKVRAIVKLDTVWDTYLLIGKLVDDKVIHHMEQTQGAVDEYNRLKHNTSKLQIKFLVIFVIVSLLILLAIILASILFSGNLVKPIEELVEATKKVKSGNLDVVVPEGPKNDEIGILTIAFNDMIARLAQQRSKLIKANQEIDDRRYFIETILASISIGVINVNNARKIIHINDSVPRLLSMESGRLIGKYIRDILPEVDSKITMLSAAKKEAKLSDVNILIRGQIRHFAFNIKIYEPDSEAEGYLITFDDITDLVNAQRNAAWSGVARRIAHEIKNPLTPISLATDRLKTKYSHLIDDKESFEKYIAMISKHVKDIGGMVEEFVNFARMPSPKFSTVDVCEIIKSAIDMHKFIDSGTNYNFDSYKEIIMVRADPAQLNQVFVNLIKNSEEAIVGIKNPQISIKITAGEEKIIIEVRDNGPGFSEKLKGHLMEPYVTTKEKGTGIGLAVVKKIIDDHNGKILLSNDSDTGGAVINIELPSYPFIDVGPGVF